MEDTVTESEHVQSQPANPTTSDQNLLQNPESRPKSILKPPTPIKHVHFEGEDDWNDDDYGDEQVKLVDTEEEEEEEEQGENTL